MKHWCLGNEMDGPWQMGHMTAREYGRKARDSARQIRVVDPDHPSSSRAAPATRSCPPTWSGTARSSRSATTRWTAISLHNYYGNTPELTGNDSSRYLAMNLDMERQIQEIAAVCDYVQGVLRSRKRLWLSFDEWNVWYRARGGRFANGERRFAPHLLEEVYNLEDALLVGGFLNTLLRQSDRVRVGCLAQIVNVIAPLVHERDLRPPAEHLLPLRVGAPVRARARPRPAVESETYPIRAAGLRPDFARDDRVPFVDLAATLDPANGELCLLVLNRDLGAERELVLDCRDFSPTRVLASETLTGTDLKAANTFERPTLVAPRPLEAPRPGSRMTFKLPARSYSVVHMATT